MQKICLHFILYGFNDPIARGTAFREAVLDKKIGNKALWNMKTLKMGVVQQSIFSIYKKGENEFQYNDLR